jgi:hypothetical protein
MAVSRQVRQAVVLRFGVGQGEPGEDHAQPPSAAGQTWQQVVRMGNGQRRPLRGNARFEGKRAAAFLATATGLHFPVTGLIAVVGDREQL